MPEPAPASGDLTPNRYPGERLGLPEEGTGSVARVGRRVAALGIDWAAAMLLAMLFAAFDSTAFSWITLGIFALMQILFIPTLGGSVGHRFLGLRVVPMDGGWVGPWRPVVRTVLLVLVIPALIWDADQRGFHDKLAGTILLRS